MIGPGLGDDDNVATLLAALFGISDQYLVVAMLYCTLLPMMSRALPLLLLFVTFLFINAEVWQVSATLDGGVMWMTVLTFTAMAVGFLLVRLPEELDRVDDEVEAGRVDRSQRGGPRPVPALAGDGAVEPLARSHRQCLRSAAWRHRAAGEARPRRGQAAATTTG